MLKTKQVGAYTITQMGPLEGARLRLHLRNLETMNLPAEVDEQTRYNWALIAACVTPFISWADYISTPMSETNPLAVAAEDLNADMVTGDTPEQAKKKPRK